MCVWVKVKRTGLVWVTRKLCVCVIRCISKEQHSHKVTGSRFVNANSFLTTGNWISLQMRRFIVNIQISLKRGLLSVDDSLETEKRYMKSQGIPQSYIKQKSQKLCLFGSLNHFRRVYATVSRQLPPSHSRSL